MAISFNDVVLSRRSVRKYDLREIPPQTLSEIIDLARRAPTSMDGQPCVFIVIRERRTCRELARIKNLYCPPEKRAYPADFLADAPAIVAVCVERRRSNGREIENGVLASGFLLLAAASCGLSGVFLTAYNRNDPGLETSIRELLKIPEDIDPIALLPLGYGATDPPEKSLRDQGEIVRYERFAQ